MSTIRELAVILEGREVARIERTRAGVLRLTYTDDARRPGRTPLSLSLPVEEGTIAGERVSRYLAGLLPENPGVLAQIARRTSTDPTDPLSLLSVIGKDCAGAVQLCTPDDVEATLNREGSLVRVTTGEIEQRIAELRLPSEASWVMAGEHWSLGGTQGKFALRNVDGRWFEARGAAATSHIIKPGIRELRAQALVEHVTMRAAAACGVAVASTEYATFGSETAIVISRFDRRPSGAGETPVRRHRDASVPLHQESLERLHQEDLCQALGVREKYEADGGPTAADIVRLLRQSARTARDAEASVARFIDGIVFNTVVAAPDAHARNYAVLLDSDRVTLAPLFDVATSLAYTQQSERVLSMSVGGEFVAERIGADHWRRLAETSRVDPERLLARVDELAELVPSAFATVLAEVAEAHDDWDGSIAEVAARLLPAVADHAARVRQR